jgi:hypothetical protein
MGIWGKVVALVRMPQRAKMTPPAAWLEGERADRGAKNPYKQCSAEYVDWMEGYDQGQVSKDAW